VKELLAKDEELQKEKLDNNQIESLIQEIKEDVQGKRNHEYINIEVNTYSFPEITKQKENVKLMIETLKDNKDLIAPLEKSEFSKFYLTLF
jgi:predicted RNA-binding protein with EMAP domain